MFREPFSTYALPIFAFMATCNWLPRLHGGLLWNHWRSGEFLCPSNYSSSRLDHRIGLWVECIVQVEANQEKGNIVAGLQGHRGGREG